MIEKMKVALWTLFLTTGDDGDKGSGEGNGADAGGSDAGGSEGLGEGLGEGAEGQGSSDGDGKGSGEGAAGTPLNMDEIPEGLRSMFEGITTQEDLAAKLKGPDIPDKYENPEMPEGATLDEKAFTDFQPVAKELGLTQAQVDKLIGFQSTVVESQTQQIFDNVLDLQAQGYKAELGKLQESMGDKFKPAHEQSVGTIEAIVDADVLQELKATGLMESPLMHKFGQQIYQKLMKEDGPPAPNMAIKAGLASGDPATAKNFYDRMGKM